MWRRYNHAKLFNGIFLGGPIAVILNLIGVLFAKQHDHGECRNNLQYMQYHDAICNYIHNQKYYEAVTLLLYVERMKSDGEAKKPEGELYLHIFKDVNHHGNHGHDHATSCSLIIQDSWNMIPTSYLTHYNFEHGHHNSPTHIFTTFSPHDWFGDATTTASPETGATAAPQPSSTSGVSTAISPSTTYKDTTLESTTEHAVHDDNTTIQTTTPPPMEVVSDTSTDASPTYQDTTLESTTGHAVHNKTTIQSMMPSSTEVVSDSSTDASPTYQDTTLEYTTGNAVHDKTTIQTITSPLPTEVVSDSTTDASPTYQDTTTQDIATTGGHVDHGETTIQMMMTTSPPTELLGVNSTDAPFSTTAQIASQTYQDTPYQDKTTQDTATTENANRTTTQRSTMSHISTEQQSTTKNMPKVTTTVVPVPASVICMYCTSDGCLAGQEIPTQCNPGEQCMTSVSEHPGVRVIDRTCAPKDTCYQKWWLGTSDREECTRIDMLGPTTFSNECTFCCETDLCNQGPNMMPEHPSQFSGNPFVG